MKLTLVKVMIGLFLGGVWVTPIRAVAQDSEEAASGFKRMLGEIKKAGIPTNARGLQAPLPPPEKNAAPLYSELTRLLKAKPLKADDAALEALAQRRSWPTEAQFRQAAQALERRKDALSLLHRAAARPLCVFTRRWNTPNPATLLFPEFAILRRGVRMLTAESLVLAHKGASLQAVQNQALGFAIARHAASDPTFLSHLVGISVDVITLGGMERLLYLAGEKPPVAAAVQAAIEKAWKPHRLASALRGEIGLELGVVEYLRKKGRDSLSEIQALAGENARLPEVAEEQWNTFLDENGVLIWSRMRTTLEVADRPYPEAIRALRLIIEDVANDKDEHHVLAAILLPALNDIFAKDAQIRAQIDIVRTAAALLVYKARQGTFPATLEGVLHPLPTDAFDGQPLRYRGEGAGFVLYSVGPDGSFEGGAGDTKPNNADSVFRYPRPLYYAPSSPEP